MTSDVALYALIGFAAQLVDGIIGMASGVISPPLPKRTMIVGIGVVVVLSSMLLLTR